MWRRFLGGLGVWWLLCSSPAHAGPIYSYVFDQSNYTVAPGGTVAVQLFLQEDDTNGGSAFLKNVGLVGAGVLVNFHDLGPTQPAQVLSLADILPNIAPGGPFDGPNTILFTAGVSAGFTESVDVLSPPSPAGGSGPVYQILLGTLRFTTGGVPGEVTHLSATRTVPDSRDNVGADFPPTVLDDQIQNGSATITVSGSAVPEPAGVVLVSTAVLGLLGYGWRWRERC